MYDVVVTLMTWTTVPCDEKPSYVQLHHTVLMYTVFPCHSRHMISLASDFSPQSLLTCNLALVQEQQIRAKFRGTATLRSRLRGLTEPGLLFSQAWLRDPEAMHRKARVRYLFAAGRRLNILGLTVFLPRIFPGSSRLFSNTTCARTKAL